MVADCGVGVPGAPTALCGALRASCRRHVEPSGSTDRVKDPAS